MAVVAHHPVRPPRARARLMAQHRDGQRRNPALGRLRNRGRGAAIDDTGGQVPEQVDDLRPGGLLDQPGVARTDALDTADLGEQWRSEEHTSELQSLMRISFAVFCLKKKKK